MSHQVLGIVGSYRKGGVIDSLVSETLASAEAHGARTEKIYLVDQHIEFCTNCRTCTDEPGAERGACVHDDDMEEILGQHARATGIVLGAPVNFFNVNAITRRFMERLLGFAYWPWGQMGPTMRSRKRTRKAVLITSSAMPGWMARVATGAPRALRIMARTLGAKPVASIFVGLAACERHAQPSERALRQARAAGRQLAKKDLS